MPRACWPWYRRTGKRLERSRDSIEHGANSLLAFHRGESGIDARVGAMMVAEFMAVVQGFIVSFAEARSK